MHYIPVATRLPPYLLSCPKSPIPSTGTSEDVAAHALARELSRFLFTIHTQNRAGNNIQLPPSRRDDARLYAI